MQRSLKKAALLLTTIILLGTALSSCYMPAEDDYSVVPCTNNPSVTRSGSGDFSPAVGF